ncbi:MAG: glycosyltransferase family 4 protein [Verrucomicrobia bacterium]|nr:glycosyltransferase family 4 protein [Verrucomicrobiota bacterium]
MRSEYLAPKILFVDYTAELGGGQLCLADIAVHLRNRCEVFLFESGPFQELLEKDGVVVRVPKRDTAGLSVRKKSSWFSYLSSIPALLSLVVSLARVASRFDLLYANTAKAVMVAVPVALLLRKPLLVHLHDIIGPEHFNRLNSWLFVAGANLAKGIVANSDASAAAYRKAGGKNRNLEVVPNGFAVERFGADVAAQSRILRKALGGEDKPLVGLFGRIAAWKGQKVLIEALKQLPDVNGVIVGDALFTEADQQYKRELFALTEKLGVSTQVQFEGFQTDVLPYLKAVDVVVHCSTSPEPFGRVIVEAQLAGKPVIATKGGGPSEIIEDRVTGILVSPSNSVELASAIYELLENRKWAGQLAANGRQAAIRRFGLDSVLKEWTDFINRNAPAVITPRPATEDGIEKARARPAAIGRREV